MYDTRISALREKMTIGKYDAVLIMRPENVYYFTGFTGTASHVIITHEDVLLLTDFRYLEQASQQAKHCKVLDIGNDLYKLLSKHLNDFSVGYEEDFLTVKQFSKLQDSVEATWLELNNIIEKLRTVKDNIELECLRKAADIADQAFLHILKYIVPGITELDIASELEYIMRKAGSEGPSFDFIVASGVRGSMPHGVASQKKISSGEFITLDFGAIYKGYHSDITRTVSVGEPPTELLKVYELVQKAQKESLEMVKPGNQCKAVDARARDIISAEGFGAYFRHGLGHGLGLDVHELPRLNTMDETILAPNMVTTVEPGIYLPGSGGVRIEDSVIVTQDGYELLTKVTKDLIIL